MAQPLELIVEPEVSDPKKNNRIELTLAQLTLPRDHIINLRLEEALALYTGKPFAQQRTKNGKTIKYLSRGVVRHLDTVLKFTSPFRLPYGPVRIEEQNGSARLTLSYGKILALPLANPLQNYLLLEYIAMTAPVREESLELYKRIVDIRYQVGMLKEAEYGELKRKISLADLQTNDRDRNGICLEVYARLVETFCDNARDRNLPLRSLKRVLNSAVTIAERHSDFEQERILRKGITRLNARYSV